jgi:hypothetical protein
MKFILKLILFSNSKFLFFSGSSNMNVISLWFLNYCMFGLSASLEKLWWQHHGLLKFQSVAFSKITVVHFDSGKVIVNSNMH